MAPTTARTGLSGKRTSTRTGAGGGNGRRRNRNGAAPAVAAENEAKANPVREAGSAIAAAMLEAADPSTGEHSGDVELVVTEICRRLDVDADLRETILVAARLHDVGKVAVPKDVLAKGGPLDEAEWELVKQHTVTGERILRAVPELASVALLVRHSHEHFDGGGYPDGLAGEEIPLGSRIILAADAFHAIRSDRPYRSGRSTPETLKEMKRCAGTQFDPRVVSALAESVHGNDRGRSRVRKLPPRLALLFAALAIGTGGAFAAERGWIPSPIPGLGPDGRPTERAAQADPTAAQLEAGIGLGGEAAADGHDGDEGATGSGAGAKGGASAPTSVVAATSRKHAKAKASGRVSATPDDAAGSSTATGASAGSGAGESNGDGAHGGGAPGGSAGGGTGPSASGTGGGSGGGPSSGGGGSAGGSGGGPPAGAGGGPPSGAGGGRPSGAGGGPLSGVGGGPPGGAGGGRPSGVGGGPPSGAGGGPPSGVGGGPPSGFGGGPPSGAGGGPPSGVGGGPPSGAGGGRPSGVGGGRPNSIGGAAP